jgi:outer membrane biosynthesis protein TonB
MSEEGGHAWGARRPFPALEVVLSVGAHLLVGGVLLAADAFVSPAPPLIDPDMVMEVTSLSALPRPTSAIAQKPEHTPEPPPPEPEPEAAPPPPEPEAEPAPPPPKPPEMALPDPKKKEEPKKKEDPKKKEEPAKAAPVQSREDARAQLLNQARKEALLRDLGTPEGTENRPRTDPNGVDPDKALFGTQGGKPVDPELARYYESCKKAISANWTPLPTTVSAHPDYKVGMMVTIQPDGTLERLKTVNKSPDASFNRSVELAVDKTGKCGPPPSKFHAGLQKGIPIEFVASEKK